MDFTQIATLYIGGNEVQELYLNGSKVWQKGGGLKFTANTAGSTIKLQAVGSAPSVDLLYSTDGTTWNTYTVGDTITLTNVDDYVLFKAGTNGNTATATNASNYNRFVMTGSVAASESILYLLSQTGQAELSDECFNSLFYGCSALTATPQLPSTQMKTGCYYRMFGDCTELTTPPDLPATELA